MENQKVHEYTVETGPNGLPVARLGRVHNLITIGRDGGTYNYLDGRFVLDNGQPDKREIPEEVRRQCEALVFNPSASFDADVLVNCEFCPYQGPSREYAKHLANSHIRPTQAAPVPEVGVGETLDPTQTKKRPEDYPPEEMPVNGYECDADGFVVMNKDGSPRKKAGRPRSE